MSSSLFDNISCNSADIAVIQDNCQFSYQQLFQQASQRAEYLKEMGAQRVATILDNSFDWLLFDLACQLAEICFVPLPHFFTEEQIQHAILETSIDTLFVHKDSFLQENHQQQNCPFDDIICLKNSANSMVELPQKTSKITFTSGSTGKPKGVCLSVENQLKVAQSLVEAINIKNPKHLCLLPLSTLLENIAGIYAPLMSGGTVIVTNSESRGLSGSSMLNPQALLTTISINQPNTLILVPELLLLLVTAAEQGWPVPGSLKFIAVGGSKVAAGLLERAETLKLPVYQGYGLSECASVVCLSKSNENKLGSVGKILPHLKIELENQQLIVKGNNFLGYVADRESWYPDEVFTGDLAQIDAEGFISINGRIKNLIISSFGRNISPEWIESECLQTGLLNQCFASGDAKPWCVTLVSPTNPSLEDCEIDSWMMKVNKNLPDYAQIKNWMRLPRRLSLVDDLLTENGRPKRASIETYYQTELEQLFSKPHKLYPFQPKRYDSAP